MATLLYIGPRLSTGEPERNLSYDGIPAGDLESDTLTDEQLAIVERSGLYQTSGAPAPARKPRPKRTPKPKPQEPTPDSEPATEPADSGEEE